MSTVATAAQNRALDWKRYLWPLGLLIPTLPFAAVGLVKLTGWNVFYLWGPFFFYLLVPLLEWLAGADPENLPEEKVPQLEADRYYRYVVFAFAPLLYAGIFFSAWVVGTQHLAWWEILMFASTVGLASATGLNASHEAGHKHSALERRMAQILLAPCGYVSFNVEHNRGHHRRVSTPEDPASSRLGESFWTFVVRSISGSLRSGWTLEKERLARRDHSAWHWDNEILQTGAITVLLYAGLTALFGWPVLGFLLLQGLYGSSLLENVNYLEHYGLLRAKNADGRYERCQPRHSWNSNHLVTNLLLFHLQRHSDHHAYPTRYYQSLRHYQDVPQLPAGYMTLIPLTYVPPLWRRVMDHRVAAALGYDMSKANIQPGKEEEMYARWHRPAPAAAR